MKNIDKSRRPPARRRYHNNQRLLLLMPLIAVAAEAAPIAAFNDPQSFFNAVQVASTETFDAFAPGTLLGIGDFQLNGMSYASADPSARWITTNSFITPSPPNSLVQQNVIAPLTLTIADGIATPGIGFFLVGLGGIPIATYRIEVAGAGGERFTEVLVTGTTTATYYRGFALAEGIISVTISPVETAGSISNFHLDNVSRGALIPEPTTAVMVLVAAIFTGVLLRGAPFSFLNHGQEPGALSHADAVIACAKYQKIVGASRTLDSASPLPHIYKQTF